MMRAQSVFAWPETAALLRQELASVTTHAAQRPRGVALIVQACAVNRALRLDAHQLTCVRMHLQRGRLEGDLACAVDALPWNDNMFELIVAQHAGDALATAGGLFDELARVLAPGGVLLWFGLNPLSPWLAWAHWRGASGAARPYARTLTRVRREIALRQLTPGAIDYVGGLCSRSGAAAPRHPLAAFRRAYLLRATKPHAALTPMRPHASRARALARPQLVATPSRRAQA